MLRIIKYLFILVAVLLTALAGYIYANKVPDMPIADLTERWAPLPSQFVEIAGMQVHLRDEGPKNELPPIVLIHGTGASLHTWDGWVEELKKERRVIRFDLPGFGLTGPDPKSLYTIEHYADVVVAVLDSLKVEKAILAGNSLGGFISWATTVLHPERVSDLILVDASGYYYDPKSVPIAFKLTQVPVVRSLITGFLPKSLVKRSVKNVYGNPELVTDELVQRYYELSLREGNRGALKERFKQTLPGALMNRISEITVPTLILWGQKDELIPPKFADKFAHDIPNNQLVMFKNLGHVPQEEDPQATVKAVKDFLAVN